MRALFRKAFVDLRSRRLQTILILVILTAATATLSLAATIQRSAANPWDRAFDESNGGHIWFYSNRDIDLAPIAQSKGVTEATDPLPFVYDQNLVLNHEKYNILLYGMPAELPDVGRPLVTDGRWLNAAGTDEIVLERTFALSTGLKVDDRADILTADGIVSLKVVGLAINTEFGVYPNWQPARVFVLPETLSRITTDPQYLGQAIGVRLADPQAVAPFADGVLKMYPEGAVDYRDWLNIRSFIDYNNKFFVIFLGVFSLFALLAVGFIIVNAIGGAVLSQFREIGLLKAVGFTPGQVIFLFELEYLGLGFVSGVAGLALGIILAPIFLSQTAKMFNSTPMPVYDPLLFLCILLGVELAVALSTLVPAWQGGHIRTVQAITTGFARVQSKPSLLARLATSFRLPPVIVLGFKDAFSRPLRAAFTIFGLSLTVLMVMFTLCLENAAQTFVKDPAMRGVSYDMDVGRGYLSDAETRNMLAQPEVSSYISAYYTERWVEAKIVGESYSIETRVISGDYEKFRFIIPEGRMFSAPGEAVAGKGLLDLLHLKVGDDLQLLVDGKPLNLHIVGRYVEMSNMGQMAMYSLETLHQQVDPGIEPTWYALKLAPGTDSAALKDTLLRLSNDQFQVEVIDNDPPAMLNQLNYILLGLNIVLVAIGLVNLLNTTLLGVRERMRDFGLLKTIGLTPRQVIISVTVGVSLMALLAVAVGIPLGLFVTRVLFDYLVNMLGMGVVITVNPAWWQVILLIPGALIMAVLGSTLPAYRAGRSSVVEVLRYE